MRKLLVVDDEDTIREIVVLNLRRAGYEVVEAESAEKALSLFDGSFSLALLDIMLPGMNGLTLCEKLRSVDENIGIIMLSAKSLESDKIGALSIGADDYVSKPFSVSELLARVSALTRRIPERGAVQKQEIAEDANREVSGEFVLDKAAHMLLKNGVQVELTQVEFQIMEYFFENQGVALVREKILEYVWGANYFGDVKIVDVNIRRLRMKIEDEPSEPKYILTVWGYGYRWSV